MVTDIKLFRPRKQGDGKAQKTVWANISKKLDLSPFRFFSLSRSNVLLTLRYIHYNFEVFIHF